MVNGPNSLQVLLLTAEHTPIIWHNLDPRYRVNQPYLVIFEYFRPWIFCFHNDLRQLYIIWLVIYKGLWCFTVLSLDVVRFFSFILALGGNISWVYHSPSVLLDAGVQKLIMIWPFFISEELFTLVYIFAMISHLIISRFFEDWTFNLRTSIISKSSERLDHVRPIASLPNLHLASRYFPVVLGRLV